MNERVKNIEFRWSNFKSEYELVKWYPHQGKECCYTLANFLWNKDGYYMETIGARYQEALAEEPETVIAITQYAFNCLSAKFELKDKIQ